MLIPVEKIRPSPFLVRKMEVDEDLRRLAENIKEHGNLVPIKVRPKDGEYECVFGHRRLEAMKLAGIKECEAIVAEIDDNDAQIQALIENVQRRDMKPVEEGRALHELRVSLGGISNEKLGEVVGLTARQVRRRLDLLDLPVDIGQEIISTGRKPAEGRLTEKHGRYLRQLRDEPELQRQVAEKIKREGISGDQTLPLVQALKSARTPATRKAIVETPVTKTPEEVKAEAKIRVIRDEAARIVEAERKERKKKGIDWDKFPSAAQVLHSIPRVMTLFKSLWTAVEMGKLSPEAKRFLARKLRELIELLQGYVNVLEEPR